jgi:glycosyltransferase involved in cell wall biosynthesis
MPEIAALCPSFNRPRLLGQAIAMFQAQTLDDAELIVLEDSGVFSRSFAGPRWRVVVSDTPLPTVGSKRNLLATMTDAPYLAVMDDDDIYLPDWLAAMRRALSRSSWVRPSQALEWDAPGVLGRYRTAGEGRDDHCYGGQWGYRRGAFLASGGYPTTGSGDDMAWAAVMAQHCGPSGDSICRRFPKPQYVYQREQTGSWHTGRMGAGLSGVAAVHAMPRASADEFVIQLPAHYDAPIPDTIQPRRW